MVSDAAALERLAARRFQLPVVDQLLDQLRMVDDLVVTTHIGVFVFDGVEAVGAGGNDVLHRITVEYLDVSHGLHLKEELIPRAIRRIARAAFLRSKDGVLDAHMVQYRSEERRVGKEGRVRGGS